MCDKRPALTTIECSRLQSNHIHHASVASPMQTEQGGKEAKLKGYAAEFQYTLKNYSLLLYDET